MLETNDMFSFLNLNLFVNKEYTQTSYIHQAFVIIEKRETRNGIRTPFPSLYQIRSYHLVEIRQNILISKYEEKTFTLVS